MDGMELAKKLNGRGELKMAVENLLNIIRSRWATNEALRRTGWRK